MSKKYITARHDHCSILSTYEEAEKKAKKTAADTGEDVLILETIAKAISPVPAVEIVKL